MQIIPVQTDLLQAGSDLAAGILRSGLLGPNDILVISSKAVATSENAAIKLAGLIPSPEALQYAKLCNQDPRFTECILWETKRMNGSIASVSPFVILTSLKPEGMKTGRILCPNAGMDLSNVEMGTAIGWPKDPVTSAKKLHAALHVPIIISDSCSRPGRLGVTAFALVCAGIDPLRSEVGKKDLFKKKMLLTHEAIADQLATAANAVMGNAAQQTPAAIIRHHNIPRSGFCGWVEGIEEGEDMFGTVLTPSPSPSTGEG